MLRVLRHLCKGLLLLLSARHAPAVLACNPHGWCTGAAIYTNKKGIMHSAKMMSWLQCALSATISVSVTQHLAGQHAARVIVTCGLPFINVVILPCDSH